MDKKKIGIVCAVVVVLFLFLGFVWPGFLNGSSATTSPAVVEEVKEAAEDAARAAADAAADAAQGAADAAADAAQGAADAAADAAQGAADAATGAAE